MMLQAAALATAAIVLVIGLLTYRLQRATLAVANLRTQGKGSRTEIGQLQLAMTPDWVGHVALLQYALTIPAVILIYFSFPWWALLVFGVAYFLFPAIGGLLIPFMPHSWNLAGIEKHLQQTHRSSLLGRELPVGATTDVSEMFALADLTATLREDSAAGRANVEAIAAGYLGTRREPDQMAFFDAMEEMVREAERTYRGMIALYNEEIASGMLSGSRSPAMPTGRGLYKARLLGALFMAAAYLRAGASEQKGDEFISVATGMAIEPLTKGGDVRLTREEATLLITPFLKPALKSVFDAFRDAPILPGATSAAHNALSEHLHDALAESLGAERYTAKARERFDIHVRGSMALALNHASRWAIG